MENSLLEYSQKRNFAITPEPKGGAEASEDELRFVVQHHIARADHYDFRLEWRGALLSWAVPKGPSFNPKDKRLAVHVEDHPLEYRHFEGTIPKGEYGGGTVMLWDEGIWEPLGNVDEGLSSGSLKFVLHGKRLRGRWALIRMKPKPGEGANNWLLLKERDEFAREEDGISVHTTSIRTGRTMEEIEQGTKETLPKNPFSHTEVQLAKLVRSVPEGEDWLFELKYDGYRIVAYVEANSARLFTRNGNDYTGRFRRVADALIDWAAGRALVLDGEMAVTDEQGRTDFQALQGAIKNPAGKNLTYIVFDLLALNGEDLRHRPLIERKELLEELMQNAPKALHYSRHVKGNGKESFAAACRMGLEGIVGKRADSTYTGTRDGSWIKLKCGARQEFVVGGYTRTAKKTRGFSALLLGVYENGELVYAGRAGTGFSRSTMEELSQKFEPLIRQNCPFQTTPKKRSDEILTWLSPELAAEIQFAEWTDEGLLRQASFKGLRTDKDPKKIQREQAKDQELLPSQNQQEERPVEANQNSITVAGVRISSPDKVIFENPAITKAEVAQYYENVAERMLPYVRRRVLSILRCPKGVMQSCFYKKHPGPGSKGIFTIPVTNSEGETEEYFYIEDIAGLVSEAQMGTLEFHTWGSRVDALEQPDMMVFDLDPDEGLDLSAVRQGVWDLKGVLSELSLTAFLKTSGGKGYHVVVPFLPSVPWDVFYDFSKRVAAVLESKWPDRYTTNVRKNKRANKIFIDWMRNGRGATSVAPYSLRARPGAKVSMPIAWEELNTIAPGDITMEKALQRIVGEDPWKGFFEIQQMLK
ncbi:MAG: DNA ligase D [Christensenellales bacterium]|jgi:bifunctional non-homologous end joining protein LigD